MISSGFGASWFEAGNWTMRQDTITLSFVDSRQQVIKTDSMYLDRKKSILIFQKGEATGMGMRLMMNKL
jgi:hypothetical protein